MTCAGRLSKGSIRVFKHDHDTLRVSGPLTPEEVRTAHDYASTAATRYADELGTPPLGRLVVARSVAAASRHFDRERQLDDRTDLRRDGRLASPMCFTA